MKLVLVAVGLRLPAWAEAGVAEYAKRFPPELHFEVKTVKAEPREQRTAAQAMTAEAARIEAALPRGARRIAFDEHGSHVESKALAARLLAWQADGRDAALIIGGADGIDAALKSSCDERLALSALTLPHALARVMAVEALYRAWTLTINHPYHRD